MGDLPALVLLIFATYRLSLLITWERSPYALGERLRAWVGVRARGSAPKQFWYELGELVNCPYCMGVWVALILVILATVMGLTPLRDFVLWWFGVAGGQFLLTIFTEPTWKKDEL